MSDLVLAERAGHVLVTTMNRPVVRNAPSPALIDELSAVLRGADADPEIRAIILTGAEGGSGGGRGGRRGAGPGRRAGGTVTRQWTLS